MSPHLEESCGGSFAERDNHLSSTCHALFTRVSPCADSHHLLEGMLRALGVRAALGGENGQSTRAELRGVASGSSICTYAMVGRLAGPGVSRRKSRFPQSRLACRGKQIWRYDGRTGAATAPPRSCRVVPQNQYIGSVATNTIVLSSRAARTSTLSCRRTVDRRAPHHGDCGSKRIDPNREDHLMSSLIAERPTLESPKSLVGPPACIPHCLAAAPRNFDQSPANPREKKKKKNDDPLRFDVTKSDLGNKESRRIDRSSFLRASLTSLAR